MRVNAEKCIGCGICLDYCNVDAISMNKTGDTEIAVIDNDVCVECGVCYNQKACPRGAIEKTELSSYTDIFKHVISDPTTTTKETGVPGRGTEEAKTNDVTGRYQKGEIGICIDMGRPGVGCYMYDVEKVAMAVAEAGVNFPGPEHTPLAKLMEDIDTGKIKEEVHNLHVLSVIIEGKCKEAALPGVLKAVKQVEKKIDTVFSLGLVSRVNEKGEAVVTDMIEAEGFEMPRKGKVNVGLGRPLID